MALLPRLRLQLFPPHSSHSPVALRAAVPFLADRVLSRYVPCTLAICLSAEAPPFRHVRDRRRPPYLARLRVLDKDLRRQMSASTGVRLRQLQSARFHDRVVPPAKPTLAIGF